MHKGNGMPFAQTGNLRNLHKGYAAETAGNKMCPPLDMCAPLFHHPSGTRHSAHRHISLSQHWAHRSTGLAPPSFPIQSSMSSGGQQDSYKSTTVQQCYVWFKRSSRFLWIHQSSRHSEGAVPSYAPTCH